MAKKPPLWKSLLQAALHAGYKGALDVAKLASPYAGPLITFVDAFADECSALDKQQRQRAVNEMLACRLEEIDAEVGILGVDNRETRAAFAQLAYAFCEIVSQRQDDVLSLEDIRDELAAHASLPEAIRQELQFGFDRLERRIPALFDQALARQQEEAARRFEQDYLEQVAKTFAKLQVLGVRELRDVRQSLEVAYISLFARGADDAGGPPQSAEKALARHPLLTVRGPAGSGKTTLLRWLALQCTKVEETDNPWNGGVPFFVRLRAIQGLPIDVGRFVSCTIDPRRWPQTPPDGWIAGVLKQRRAVLMIDGVDELSPNLRPALWDWLRQFVTDDYPGNRVIVTSRPFSEEDANEAGRESPAQRLWNPPADFHNTELQEMSEPDVRNFVAKWHSAVLDIERDEDERDKLEHARQALPDKLALPSNRRVRELCGTPLMCSLVCALHWREEGFLPRKRADLYHRCCEMLIAERDDKRDIPPPPEPLCYLTPDDKKMILQQLALSMMRNRDGPEPGKPRIEVTRAEAENWVAPPLKAVDDARARKCNAAAVVRHLIERTALLREPGEGFVDFSHRSFQEYLAACGAGAGNHAGELAKCAGDDQWHETIVLAAGTEAGGVPFGHDLIRKLLKRGGSMFRSPVTRRNCFALAVACLETAKQVGEELRQDVLRNLKEVVPPRNFDEAKALAVAGDAVVPALAYERCRQRKPRTIAACARTLRLIGSRTAEHALREGYFQEDRIRVLVELSATPGINPLEIDPVIRLVRMNRFEVRLCDASQMLSLRASISDLTPLADLSGLRSLNLMSTQVSDLTPLAGLSGLQSLSLSGTQVSDLTPLAGLSRLQTLDLWGTHVSDLTPLAGLSGLRMLGLFRTQVCDVTPLEHLKDLTITGR